MTVFTALPVFTRVQVGWAPRNILALAPGIGLPVVATLCISFMHCELKRRFMVVLPCGTCCRRLRRGLSQGVMQSQRNSDMPGDDFNRPFIDSSSVPTFRAVGPEVAARKLFEPASSHPSHPGKNS